MNGNRFHDSLINLAEDNECRPVRGLVAGGRNSVATPSTTHHESATSHLQQDTRIPFLDPPALFFDDAPDFRGTNP